MEDQSCCEGAIQWEKVILKLLKYAHSYACRKAGLSVKTSESELSLCVGVSPDDLMCTVITEFLGKLTPDLANSLTENDLMKMLCKAYQNRLMSFFRSPRFKTTKYAEDLKQVSKDGKKIPGSFLSNYNVEKLRGVDEHQILIDSPPVPGDDLEYAAEVQALYNMAEGDPEVQEMIEAICVHDLETPREIAVRLKTTPKDIYNRMKRMRRMFEKLRQSYRETKKAV